MSVMIKKKTVHNNQKFIYSERPGMKPLLHYIPAASPTFFFRIIVFIRPIHFD